MRAFCREKGLALQLIARYSLTETKRDDARYERPPACAACNRIRLLADGALKPCLHADGEVKLDPADIRGSLARTILAKPRCGTVCTHRSMVEIGG